MNLSDREIDDICCGYIQNAAKVRYLRAMGLIVRTKPNGRPLVNRTHYDTIMGCIPIGASTKFDNQPVWGVH
jgi:hypothetical protein